ncbi:MAG: hypothetical protein HUK15_00995 [Bacteroidales bacterium]|nr:hypothetical protein [Bacteroidales bacterium]
MKKSLLISILAVLCLMFGGCGVGTYTVASGYADKAKVFVSTNASYDITVQIDGQEYATRTVKNIDWRSERKIKKVAKFAVPTTPGTHNVVVKREGVEIYKSKIFVSATETKLIEL